MSDVRQILIVPEQLPSFTVNHEAGVEVTHDTMGINNVGGRTDGAGNKIHEEQVVPTGCSLPQCINNKTLDTYEKVREWVRSGESATVTVSHRDGSVYQYFDAKAVDRMPLNKTKTYFPMMIEGDFNSGKQS